MKIDDCFQLGYVIKHHGLHGELSIFLDTDFPENYIKMESVYVELQQKLVPFFIESLKILNQKAIVNLSDINSLVDAQALKGAPIYLPLEFLPDLDESQFYYHEIINYKVIENKSGDIGHVEDVYEVAGNDLLKVNCRGKEVLIPIRDDIITKVDKIRKIINVTLPEGLLEIYLNS